MIMPAYFDLMSRRSSPFTTGSRHTANQMPLTRALPGALPGTGRSRCHHAASASQLNTVLLPPRRHRVYRIMACSAIAAASPAEPEARCADEPGASLQTITFNADFRAEARLIIYFGFIFIYLRTSLLFTIYNALYALFRRFIDGRALLPGAPLPAIFGRGRIAARARAMLVDASDCRGAAMPLTAATALRRHRRFDIAGTRQLMVRHAARRFIYLLLRSHC